MSHAAAEGHPLPAQVTDIHGDQVSVVTPDDVWKALKWWVGGFGVVGLLGAGTALVKVNDMQHAIQNTTVLIAEQDAAIGGHLTARLQLQSLRQTLDQLQVDVSESKQLQQAIARAVHATVIP